MRKLNRFKLQIVSWSVMRAVENMFRIALMGLSALIAWKGIELSRFAWVKEHVDEVILLSPRQDKAQVAKVASELEPVITSWQNVVGVRSDAVFASVRIKRVLSSNNFRNLEPEAKAILAVRPMSAQAWILLAGTRILSGQPIEKPHLDFKPD